MPKLSSDTVTVLQNGDVDTVTSRDYTQILPAQRAVLADLNMPHLPQLL
jgi:hypothetical protein